MKMSGIKSIGFATLLGAGTILTGCGKLQYQENRDYVENSGITAKEYKDLKLGMWTDLRRSTEEYWQMVKDSVYWTKKLDSTKTTAFKAGKQAAIDSLKTVK
jgi:hypothetical protein